jgi:putative transposase
MLKAYKYRIYPTQAQQAKLVQDMGCVRFIYNAALAYCKESYDSGDKKLKSKFTLINEFLMPKKAELEWLKDCNAQSLQSALGNLETAYKTFFKNKKGFPKFKKRSNISSIQYPQKVKIYKNKIQIPKIGRVNFIQDKFFAGKIKTCTVSKTPTNKFFISILVEDGLKLPEKCEVNYKTSIGIDLGIKTLITTSNGDKIKNPKTLKNNLQRLKVLQRRVSKKKNNSNNRKKAQLKVAKLHEKITNTRKDNLHKISTKIISENQTVIIEDLNISGMIKNHKLSQSIQDASWSELIRMLKYKAEWSGKNIIQIGRFEPSSKMCSKCFHKNKDLELKDREWECLNCHAKHDRDLNAAINIKNLGLIDYYKTQSGQDMPIELVEMSKVLESLKQEVETVEILK